MIVSIWRDFRAIKDRDPAARWFLDRLLCHPGFHALVGYRVAHVLWRLRLRLLARLVSSFFRLLTGVEIHPGAKIGSGVVIDHGMGVVIGETAIVRDNVTLFQGVTLGGTGKESGKRHPNVEEGVVVGAGANVLGNITLGANSRVGAGSVVVRDVPPGATVVGVPGRVVVQDGQRRGTASLEHGDLPDPIREALEQLAERLRVDEEKLNRERTILEDIAVCKRREVLRLKHAEPAGAVVRPEEAFPVRDFTAAISAPGLSLIGEIKRASPSAGVIRDPFVPAELARAYERGGAKALSVLTDRCYFEGSLAHLKEARAAAVSLPVLRKDFIIDEVQLREAQSAGADAVLLIARMLSEADLKRLVEFAGTLGMATLVEVHERRELKRALASGSRIIGVNNRDLAEFTVDLNNTLRLAEDIPDEMLLVSESGIRTADDLKRLASAGVDAVLIGETFMREPDVEAAVARLFGSAGGQAEVKTATIGPNAAAEAGPAA